MKASIARPIHPLAIFVLIILASCRGLPPDPISTPVESFPGGRQIATLLAGLLPGAATSTPAPGTPASAPPNALTPILLGAGRGVQGAWFELYFTDPSSPLSSQKTGGLDGPMVTAIDQARLSLDVAMYSFSLNSIRDALIRAHSRGVQVRVVIESDSLSRADPQALLQAGIPIIGDRREGLMHNKFIIVDSSEVWMGSMNFTDTGAYEDNNNLVRFRSTRIAENFTLEFNEMFVDDKFGPDAVARTPHPRVTIDATPIDIYFSPDDGVEAGLLELIENAGDSIHILAYSFTSDSLGEAIRAAAVRGVDITGVMDGSQIESNIGTEYDPFRQAGLDVRVDGNPGLMHHKVMIIDRQIVITGSYNFTANAEDRNDENLVVIYDAAIAAEYYTEFIKVYSEAQD